MAPVSQSPYRFLSGQRRPQSPGEDDEAPHVHRNQFSKLGQDASQPEANHSTPRQFAPAPRFSSGRIAQDTAQPTSSHRSSFAHALQGPRRSIEDVEEAGQSQEGDEEMLDAERPMAESTVDVADQNVTGVDWQNDLPYSPKRRRLDDSKRDGSGHFSSLTAPQRDLPTPVTPATHLTPRKGLHFSRAQSAGESAADGSAALRRAAFLRPPAAAAPDWHQQPLPEIFSPHRRGQKFVPGGMAATVQQWVVEAGQAATQTRARDRMLPGADHAMRVHVREVSGGRPCLVKGELEDGEKVYVLLAGEEMHGSAFVDQTVAIRAPVFRVPLREGVTSYVGVDWQLLP